MKTKFPQSLSVADIRAARRRLADGIAVTPCAIAAELSAVVGSKIWLKREDLHRTGSFKERGACHALLCREELIRRNGAVAASAGNHALGLAYHGGRLGMRVAVVMPITAPEVKIARCRDFGAEVILHGENFDAAHAHAKALADGRGAAFVHPFDDRDVIAGQGTMAFEILEQMPQFDTLVVPVGGGGLLAGVATVVKALRPDVRIIGVEPVHAAGFFAARMAGRPIATVLSPTTADGLAVAKVGHRAFGLAASRVDDAVRVSESELAAAIAALARSGIVAEGAGATALAAVLAGKILGRAIVAPVTGRNIDARLHARLVASPATAGCSLPPRCAA